MRAGVAYSVTNTTDVPESISISIYGLESKITVVNVYHHNLHRCSRASTLVSSLHGLASSWETSTLTVLSSGVPQPTHEGAS